MYLSAKLLANGPEIDWPQKQSEEMFSEAEWTTLTDLIRDLIKPYPQLTTYNYSFKDRYTKIENVKQFGIMSKYPSANIKDELMNGKWLIFLPKQAFTSKVYQIIKALICSDVLCEVKFRNYPILNEEAPNDVKNNFLIISHELKYEPDSPQRKVFSRLDLEPIFRFDLERRLDLLYLAPDLHFTYKNILVLSTWLATLKDHYADLFRNNNCDLYDLERAINKIETNIEFLKYDDLTSSYIPRELIGH